MLFGACVLGATFVGLVTHWKEDNFFAGFVSSLIVNSIFAYMATH